jgi:hypothetical protein
MKTLFDPSDRAALLARFDRLTPDSRPAWGKMNVGQMVCHVSDALRAALGDLPCAPKKSLLSNPVMRWLVIHHLPWPRGVPTSPELLSTPPAAELESDKQEFRRLAEAFAARGAQGITAVHPAFGDISGKTWGALMHRHVDHHLRQFGV